MSEKDKGKHIIYSLVGRLVEVAAHSCVDVNNRVCIWQLHKQKYNTDTDCNQYLVPSVRVHFPPAQSAIQCSHWGFPQTGCCSAAPPRFSSVVPPYVTRHSSSSDVFREFDFPLINTEYKHLVSVRLAVTHLTHDCELQWQVLHLHKVFFIRLLTGVTWAHLLHQEYEENGNVPSVQRTLTW